MKMRFCIFLLLIVVAYNATVTPAQNPKKRTGSQAGQAELQAANKQKTEAESMPTAAAATSSQSSRTEKEIQKKQKFALQFFDAKMFDDERVRDLINEYSNDVEQGKELFLVGYTTPDKKRDISLAEKITNKLKDLLQTRDQVKRFIRFNANPLDDNQVWASHILEIIDDVLQQTQGTLTKFLPKIIELDQPPFLLLEPFIAAGANINDETVARPYLIRAIKDRSARGASLTIFLLAHGANPNMVAGPSTLFAGHTPLMIAAEEGNFNTVRELLEAGANPNVISPSTGKTPLMELMKFARFDDEDVAEISNQNKIETLRLFLQKNVNLQIQDSRHKTALDYATPAVRKILTEDVAMEIQEEPTELAE